MATIKSLNIRSKIALVVSRIAILKPAGFECPPLPKTLAFYKRSSIQYCWIIALWLTVLMLYSSGIKPIVPDMISIAIHITKELTFCSLIYIENSLYMIQVHDDADVSTTE